MVDNKAVDYRLEYHREAPLGSNPNQESHYVQWGSHFSKKDHKELPSMQI